MTSSEFTYVQRAGKTPSNKNRKARNEPVSFPEQLVRISRELDQLKWTMKVSDVWSGALDELGELRTPKTCLCLGLGSPTTSPHARAQLALLLIMCEKAQIPHSDISFYDPIFSAEDHAALASLSLNVLRKNERGRHPIKGPTLLFMPHCGIALYENVLRTNWGTIETLREMIFVANNFGTYVDITPQAKLEKETPCVARVAPILTSRVLPPSPSHPTAFNELAIQFLDVNAPSLHVKIGSGMQPNSAEYDAFWSLPDRVGGDVDVDAAVELHEGQPERVSEVW